MEDFRTIAQKSLNEVTDSLGRTDPKRFGELVEALGKKRAVLVTGDGFCGGVVRVFAQGLARLGVNVSVVGDSTTLGVKLGDLLVVVSESGNSGTAAERVKAARNQGVSVVVVTGDARSRLLADAQLGIILPGPTRTPFTPQGPTGMSGLVFAEAAMIYLDAAVRGLAAGVDRRDVREMGAGAE